MIELSKTGDRPQSYIDTYGHVFATVAPDENGCRSSCVRTAGGDLLKLVQTTSQDDGMAMATIRVFYRGYDGDAGAEWMGPLVSVCQMGGKEKLLVGEEFDRRIPTHLLEDPEATLDSALFERSVINDLRRVR